MPFGKNSPGVVMCFCCPKEATAIRDKPCEMVQHA